MHKTSKKLLSVLLALAMVLSLLPGAALRAAADDVTYVQITSTPTAEMLANMITYSQDEALAIYNSAEFQAGAGPNGGIVLIFNIGEADGEYMVIHNAQGTPEVMSVGLDIIGMLLQYGFNVYIVQAGGSDAPAPDVHSHDNVEFADWNDALAAEQNGEGKTASNSLPSSPGCYHLTSDVGIASTWTVPEGETELCLDGHTIRYTGSNGGVILLNNANAKLTVYDCGTTGAITGGNTTGVGGGVSLTAGTFELKNGRIEGNVASNGGGVSVAGSSASFIMSGGAVQYNCGYGSSTAGGVRMRNGSFTMTGGAIQYNVGAGFGGLSLSAGIQPKMSGTPVIKENVIFSSGLSRTNTKITKTDSGYTLAEGGTPCDVKHVTANGLKIQLLGQLESGAQIGIFNNRQSAEFTDGYKTYNPDDDPANFFFSNDSSRYIALSTGKEALLGGYFTVTWKDEDGTVLEIDENVQTGTLPEFNGTLPEKPEDDLATYTATWLPRVVPVAGSDVTYTIAYRPTTKRGYQITMDSDWGERLVESSSSLWYDITGSRVLRLYNTSYEATKVTRVSGDNILYLDGTNITVMEPGEETVRCWFSSTGYLSVTFIVKPLYNITFKLENGQPDVTKSVVSGEIPTCPDPDMDDTAQYIYLFAGWWSSSGDFYPQGTTLPAAVADVTYTANYEAYLQYYKVTWDNQGSTTSEYLGYGTVPSYDGPTPVKEADENYSYSFAGWNDGTSTYGPTDTLPAVTGEVTYTAVFDATPRHVHNVVHADEIPAGCTEPGRKAYYCCDDESCELYGRFFEDEELSVELTDLTIPALGHDYAAVVTEPSCTEGGFTTYTCSRCGDSYEDDFTEALGHDFGAWSVSEEPSCTEAGEEVRLCARCGETETRPLDALGHQPGEPVVENYVEPTGSAEGGYDTVVYCTRCSEELSREHTVLSAVEGPNADGHFYLNGEIVPCYQFVEWEGDWYFINDDDFYARDIHLDFKPVYVEGTPFEPGCYYFDAMGRLVIQNGPQANGYFYLNGIRQKAYQVLEYEGSWYFITDGNKYAVSSRRYLNQQLLANTPFSAGYYEFDENGRMVLKNGPQADGYFYLDGIKQLAYRLIEWNGDYYFINDAHKYARNVRLYLGQQFVAGSELAPGYYDFDDSGKLVIKNGPWEDGYFYINGARQSCYQLIHWEGGYYFINDGHKYAVNKRIYLSAQYIGDEPISVGYHYFGEDGRMLQD